MLVVGIFLILLSMYMILRPDTSWKWLIGITDGFLIAFCGLLILRTGRRRAAAAEEAETGEPSYPHGLDSGARLSRRLRRRRPSRRFPRRGRWLPCPRWWRP